MLTFQEIIAKLNEFWAKQGCCIHQGWDLEVGAGTCNPATFLRCLGPEPYRAAYVEPSRRPGDGRYGNNPNRTQHYFQYQVALKPSPNDIQNVYLESLKALGLDMRQHDIRFVHDDWEHPTLGAWGLGWETWIDGMEVTQITYFQCVGGINVKPVTGELTYGLERLAMYLQNVDSMFDIQWNDTLTYGDIYHRNEVEFSRYNFEEADTSMWKTLFDEYVQEAKSLIERQLTLPAYEFISKASHAFNILDARGVVSVTERTGFISQIRNLVHHLAENYIEMRKSLGNPLMGKFGEDSIELPQDERKPPRINFDKEEFLLEIGSEELPASFVPAGMNNLQNEMMKLLQKEQIPYASIQVFGTPRRISLLIKDLAVTKPAQVDEKRGPAVEQAYDAEGSPSKIGNKFFQAQGLTAPSLLDIRNGRAEQIEIRNVKGKEYLFFQHCIPERFTAEIFSEVLPSLIKNLSFPKKMRWADLDITYARPIVWITALFGSEIVPFKLGNVSSGNQTFGHRQIDPDPFELSHAEKYLEILREHYVMVDPWERKKEIDRQLDAIEKENKGKIPAREKNLAEVINLVEWPQSLHAGFDENFLKAPKELLISEMVEHQKYFPLETENGSLKNIFVVVANNLPTEAIRQGNRRVLSARLSDGVFLYEQDLKTSLSVLADKLPYITFQKQLGSLFDKSLRLEAHLEILHKYLPIASIEDGKRAAVLCKADLASAVVGEFPELQGIMGRYYALAQGENHIVAKAIEEHWMPTGEQAPLPSTPGGILLSLSDKIDNLLGCFSVGLKPTSSSDPYALRRQTLGIIKMLISGKYRIPLQEIFRECAAHFPESTQSRLQIDELMQFVINRVRTVFQAFGFAKDEIEASISLGLNDIYDIYCRVDALHRFRETHELFPLLYEVFKRAKGQINGYEPQRLDQNLLAEPAEIALNEVLEKSKTEFYQQIAEYNYDGAYALIAEIQPSLAQLFDEVKILADDTALRNNRIALLQKVFQRFGELLDFSKIQDR